MQGLHDIPMRSVLYIYNVNEFTAANCTYMYMYMSLHHRLALPPFNQCINNSLFHYYKLIKTEDFTVNGKGT